MVAKLGSEERVVCFALRVAFLLVLLDGTSTTMAETTLITVSPMSFNGSLGTTVEFMCTAIDEEGIGITWLVEGANRSTYSPSATGNMGSFRIQAIEENDGAEVVCRVVTLQDDVHRSKPAVLRVQGFLAPPDILMVSSMESASITLTWDAPPTLDLTDIYPDINNYTVYIEVNGSQIWSDTVTETEYIFTGTLEMVILHPCSVHQFSVSAWNVVGEGRRSERVEASFASVPPVIQSAGVGDVYFYQSTTPKIQLSLKVQDSNSSSCPGSINATVTCDQEETCRRQYQYDPSDGVIIISDSGCIPNNKFCEIQLTMVDNTEPSSPIVTGQFSSFDVQRVEVIASNDSITVTCSFARGSLARGCLVVFTSTNQEMFEECTLQVYWIEKSSPNVTETIKGLPAGTYNISVCDIEQNEAPCRDPAYRNYNAITLTMSTSVKPSEVKCTSKVTMPEDDPSETEDDLAIFIAFPSVLLLIIILVVMLTVWISYRLIRKKVDSGSNNEDILEAEGNYYTTNPTKPPSVARSSTDPPEGTPGSPTVGSPASDDSSSGSHEHNRGRLEQRVSASPSSQNARSPTPLHRPTEERTYAVLGSQRPALQGNRLGQETSVAYTAVLPH